MGLCQLGPNIKLGIGDIATTLDRYDYASISGRANLM